MTYVKQRNGWRMSYDAVEAAHDTSIIFKTYSNDFFFGKDTKNFAAVKFKRTTNLDSTGFLNIIKSCIRYFRNTCSELELKFKVTMRFRDQGL